ncbi:bifunctional aminoglycoside phosphotransferase/ATP-binding protein [Actinoallomurus rhizosphaericola]|uniref:bifunctional aminoglycoside phosphotransferase/ATP-binding protein n=1 Tax=Actinoallomurus rhizosphaericola TaxID=2952536 RepID=UPI0020930B13|nr:AAA family ATPase [Actinoallomurus rhizosphaericola]MCO5995533.1 AAA family ATPase [Actinoallomurus rhizosphaericola]
MRTWATDVAETHSGVVFFFGDRAYKLKKPVDLGFLDFSTRELRERACHREVDLNRRFAPDVYLGVADVSMPPGTPRDHLVVMRRMPAERRLSDLVRANAPLDDALRTVARLLARAHAASPHTAEISAEGSRDALRARWTASFEQVRPFHGRAIDAADAAEVERLTLRFLEGREPLFTARIREGRVVDGHGDLMADDIFCLDDGPRVLDCLDFDDRLRWLDGLDDAAFLAMDLERLGAPHLAGRFLSWYAEYADDPAPPSLRHHYVAYRAFVRAKVACVRWSQGDARAAEDAGRHAEIALRHLNAGAVGLILVGGLPGTGKSALSEALGDRLGRTVLNSDRVRKELAELSPDTPARAPYGTGLYDASWTRRTYAELLNRAARLLSYGESVIIDASWTSAEHRADAARVAARAHADLFQVRCDSPLAGERLLTRPRGVSDADPEIAAHMAESAAPWPEAATIDTSGPVGDAAERALAAIRLHGPGPALHRRPRMSPG